MTGLMTEKRQVQISEDCRLAHWGVQAALLELLAVQEESAVAATPANPRLIEAEGELRKASDALARLGGSFQALGVPSANARQARSLPLDQLDTEDNRELLAALEKAQQIAERVDCARGRSVPAGFPLQPGESAGMDLAESLAGLVLRVRQEVHGASSPHE